MNWNGPKIEKKKRKGKQTMYMRGKESETGEKAEPKQKKKKRTREIEKKTSARNIYILYYYREADLISVHVAIQKPFSRFIRRRRRLRFHLRTTTTAKSRRRRHGLTDARGAPPQSQRLQVRRRRPGLPVQKHRNRRRKGRRLAVFIQRRSRRRLGIGRRERGRVHAVGGVDDGVYLLLLPVVVEIHLLVVLICLRRGAEQREANTGKSSGGRR